MYICAFRGARDSYQVPLALSEAQELELLITDFYAGPGVRWCLSRAGWRKSAEKRSCPGVSSTQVRCLLGHMLRERIAIRMGADPMQRFRAGDVDYSRAAEAECRRRKANLFLYSPYAYEAFGAKYLHAPRRVLFQYHPHPLAEIEDVAQERKRFGDMFYPAGDLAFAQAEARDVRSCDAWKRADLIVCASSYTARTLLAVGADAGLIRVVPYGIDISSEVELQRPARTGPFHFLYVGSIMRRKGLHHVLNAWRQLRYGAEEKLTIATRAASSELRQIVAGLPGVRLEVGMDDAGIRRLMEAADAFIMPSMCEGFGLVYLEALAAGCAVIGTANSCLPDLGGEADGIFVVSVASADQFAAHMDQARRRIEGIADMAGRAKSCAQKFSWRRFREGLRAVVL